MAVGITANGSSPERLSTPESDSTGSLLRRLFDDVTTLFRQEIGLVTAELSQTLTNLKIGLGSVAAGGAVLFCGLLVLLAAAVLGLALIVPAWLAALLVGAVVCIVGAVMLKSGTRKFSTDLMPHRTERSLKKDTAVITRRVQ